MRSWARPIVLSTALLAGAAADPQHALAQSVSVSEATAEQKTQAEALFLEGKRLLDHREFSQALERFRQSYALVRSPNSHLMVARSLRGMDRPAEAYVEFRATAEEAAAAREKRYEGTRRAAETEAAELRERMGGEPAILTVQAKGASADAKFAVDRRELAASELGRPIAVPPGPVVVVATGPGSARVQRALTLAPGTTHVVQLDLGSAAKAQSLAAQPSRGEEGPGTARDTSTSASTGGGSMRTWAYVAGGVGVAGLATFAVFGLMNQSTFGDLEDSCPNGHCTPDQQEDIDAGRRYQTFANVGLAVGIAGLGAGTTLFLLSRKQAGPTETAASGPVDVRLGPGSLHIGGRF